MSEWEVRISYSGDAVLTITADDKDSALEQAMENLQLDDYPGMHIEYDEPELIKDIVESLERMCKEC